MTTKSEIGKKNRKKGTAFELLVRKRLKKLKMSQKKYQK